MVETYMVHESFAFHQPLFFFWSEAKKNQSKALNGMWALADHYALTLE